MEDQIAHLHAARQELESELSMLGEASVFNISDVFEEETAVSQLDRELAVEGVKSFETSPVPLAHAKSSDTLVPTSPPQETASSTSRPRSAPQQFNGGLTLDDVIAWDSLTVASWFDTVELEGMANRAFQHGLHGRTCRLHSCRLQLCWP